MNIQKQDYSVIWDEEGACLTLSGTLRLMTREYRPLVELLEVLLRAPQQPPRLVIDVKDLRMINSSGLNVLSRFVIGLRQRTNTQVVLRGARASAWQGKILANFRSFLPSADVEFE